MSNPNNIDTPYFWGNYKIADATGVEFNQLTFGENNKFILMPGTGDGRGPRLFASIPIDSTKGIEIARKDLPSDYKFV